MFNLDAFSLINLMQNGITSFYNIMLSRLFILLEILISLHIDIQYINSPTIFHNSSLLLFISGVNRIVGC